MTKRERQILDWIIQDPMVTQETLAKRAGIARSSVAVHVSNLMKKGHIVGKGYILPEVGYVAVAGAVNVDIGGQLRRAAGRRGTPTPARVRRQSWAASGGTSPTTCGLLGVEVSPADGPRGRTRMRGPRRGVLPARWASTSAARCTSPAGRRPPYLFLSDVDGGHGRSAVSDMDICERTDPRLLCATTRAF